MNSFFTKFKTSKRNKSTLLITLLFILMVAVMLSLNAIRNNKDSSKIMSENIEFFNRPVYEKNYPYYGYVGSIGNKTDIRIPYAELCNSNEEGVETHTHNPVYKFTADKFNILVKDGNGFPQITYTINSKDAFGPFDSNTNTLKFGFLLNEFYPMLKRTVNNNGDVDINSPSYDKVKPVIYSTMQAPKVTDKNGNSLKAYYKVLDTKTKIITDRKNIKHEVVGYDNLELIVEILDSTVFPISMQINFKDGNLMDFIESVNIAGKEYPVK